jgi:hypothetical protein
MSDHADPAWVLSLQKIPLSLLRTPVRDQISAWSLIVHELGQILAWSYPLALAWFPLSLSFLSTRAVLPQGMRSVCMSERSSDLSSEHACQETCMVLLIEGCKAVASAICFPPQRQRHPVRMGVMRGRVSA